MTNEAREITRRAGPTGFGKAWHNRKALARMDHPIPPCPSSRRTVAVLEDGVWGKHYTLSCIGLNGIVSRITLITFMTSCDISPSVVKGE